MTIKSALFSFIGLVAVAAFQPELVMAAGGIQQVDFVSQAPLGEWGDNRQAQGCEEAAALMAITWAKGESYTDKQMRDLIIEISDWERRKYGEYVDTSVMDTADRIIMRFMGYGKIQVQENITIQDIKNRLDEGKIVITAINGRKIAIPYYRKPGPLHHMLLVTGYDADEDAFTVNDPGTIHGKALKVSAKNLQSSLIDYPTGNGASRKELPPAMIVVGKP